MVTTFEFIVSDPVGNPKPGKSSKIRSQCMRGRNKREGSRRSKREERRLAKEEQAQDAVRLLKAPVTIQALPLYPQLSGLALMCPAGVDLDLEAKGLIVKAFAYDVTNRSLQPLESFVDFNAVERIPFEWVFSDAAFAHSILCTSYAFDDFSEPGWDGELGHKGLIHLRETLTQLHRRMSDEYAYQDEALLHAILNLVLLSAGLTEPKAALAHFTGLQKIVHLRGDLQYLATRPKLHFKLNCLDLGWFLSTGDYSLFRYPVLSWNALLHDETAEADTETYRPPFHWDFRLVNAFEDLQSFTRDINRNVDAGSAYDVPCFQGILNSLQTRLLHLREELEDPVEELICMTMLVFLTMFFNLPGRRIPLGWVAKQVPIMYARIADREFEQDGDLWSWVVMVLTVSVRNLWAEAVIKGWQDWSHDAWRKTMLERDWEKFRCCLMRIAWVGTLLDEPAKAMFTKMHNSTAKT